MAVQAVAPALETIPVGQAVQEAAPAAETVFAGQFWAALLHMAALFWLLTEPGQCLPAWQAAQSEHGKYDEQPPVPW